VIQPRVSILPNVAAIAEAAATSLVECCARAMAERGRFMVALSGGSTPQALYELLAEPPWRDQVDWSRWHVFWGDDRLVPWADPESNVGLAQRLLLSRVPVPPDQVHPTPIPAGVPETI